MKTVVLKNLFHEGISNTCVYIYIYIYTYINVHAPFAALCLQLYFCKVAASIPEGALQPSADLNEQWNTHTGF